MSDGEVDTESGQTTDEGRRESIEPEHPPRAGITPSEIAVPEEEEIGEKA